jgi:hypothetical protein
MGCSGFRQSSKKPYGRMTIALSCLPQVLQRSKQLFLESGDFTMRLFINRSRIRTNMIFALQKPGKNSIMHGFVLHPF